MLGFLDILMQVFWGPHIEINYYDKLEKSTIALSSV